ncbi:MAG: ABC transporter permease [Bacteroidales bacterium]|jgi:ABC-2 type transport system permease protein|nr:ABC transporter permease [Bacteroidales bacterium]
MNKFFAAFIKEVLLLIRDRAGIISLFVMPVILVFVMTVIEDSALNSTVDKQISMLFCNSENDSLGIAIKKGLNETKAFTIFEEVDGKKLDKQSLEHFVAEGKFPVGVYIPEGATDTLRSNARKVVLKTFSEIGLTSETNNAYNFDSVVIQIYYDPAVRNSLKALVDGAIGQHSAVIVGKMLSGMYSEVLSDFLPGGKKLNVNYPEMITVNRQYASEPDNSIIPNSTQHNVPSWTLFAMFFILIPLASSIIQEKDGGTYMRLVTMPSTYTTTFIGKITVYFIVCLLQVTILFSMGAYLIPYAGIPGLQLGSHFDALLLVVFTASYAAVAFGVLMGAFCTSYQQAASIGVILIIVLASMGGLWMPVYLMPKTFQHILVYSPLNWPLTSFYDLFLRDAGVKEVLPNVFKLFLFGTGCFIVAFSYKALKKIK